MIKGKLVAIDLAKSIFQVAVFSTQHALISNKTYTRTALKRWLVQLPPCTIAMEASSGAHYWQNVVESFGHTAVIIPPNFVKAFRQGHKTDRNDALAIARAALSPTVRLVPRKTPDRLALQGIHRIRSGFIKDRTAVSNSLRGLLAESGLVFPKGFAALKRHVIQILSDADNGLPAMLREPLARLMEHFYQLQQNILDIERLLRAAIKDIWACQELMKIKGVGLIGASQLYITLGDGTAFKNGRAASAYVGVSPKQHSSGGKTQFIGIGRSVNGSLRSVLITGAMAYINTVGSSTKTEDQWIQTRLLTQSKKQAAVAWANKVVRMAWAIITYQRPHQANYTHAPLTATV